MRPAYGGGAGLRRSVPRQRTRGTACIESSGRTSNSLDQSDDRPLPAPPLPASRSPRRGQLPVLLQKTRPGRGASPSSVASGPGQAQLRAGSSRSQLLRVGATGAATRAPDPRRRRGDRDTPTRARARQRGGCRRRERRSSTTRPSGAGPTRPASKSRGSERKSPSWDTLPRTTRGFSSRPWKLSPTSSQAVGPTP